MAIYSEEVADFIWRNGQIIPWAEATIHVNAVGHASVAGIFEGMQFDRGYLSPYPVTNKE